MFGGSALHPNTSANPYSLVRIHSPHSEMSVDHPSSRAATSKTSRRISHFRNRLQHIVFGVFAAALLPLPWFGVAGVRPPFPSRTHTRSSVSRLGRWIQPRHPPNRRVAPPEGAVWRPQHRPCGLCSDIALARLRAAISRDMQIRVPRQWSPRRFVPAAAASSRRRCLRRRARAHHVTEALAIGVTFPMSDAPCGFVGRRRFRATAGHAQTVSDSLGCMSDAGDGIDPLRSWEAALRPCTTPAMSSSR